MTETTRQRQKHKQKAGNSKTEEQKGYNNKRNSKRTEVKTKILTQQQQK